jgi:hypothetical protein
VTKRNHPTGPPLTAKVDHFFAATDMEKEAALLWRESARGPCGMR